MDYIKVLSMLSNPQYKQTAEVEINNTLTAYGLTSQESAVFLANTLHKTPIQELSSKLSLLQLHWPLTVTSIT